MKLRIKTNSSQFTPSNPEGYELLQQLQGDGKVPDEETGGRSKEVVGEAMDTTATVAGIH